MHPLPRPAHREEDGEGQAEGRKEHPRPDERDKTGRRVPLGMVAVLMPVVVRRGIVCGIMRAMIAVMMPTGGGIRGPGGGRRTQREEPVGEEAQEREHRDQPREARDRIGEGMPRGGKIGMHQPLSRLMSSRCTVWRCRKIEMMIASPTAASAAATVMTMITKTCPVAP